MGSFLLRSFLFGNRLYNDKLLYSSLIRENNWKPYLMSKFEVVEFGTLTGQRHEFVTDFGVII